MLEDQNPWARDQVGILILCRLDNLRNSSLVSEMGVERLVVVIRRVRRWHDVQGGW